MSNGEKITAAIYRTLALIAEREKLKAIQQNEYGSAFFIGILEGIFREAEISVKETRIYATS